jgi:hypothetical protein
MIATNVLTLWRIVVVDSLVNPEVEAQMKKIKALIAEIQTTQTIFTNTFQTLKPRERARTVQQITMTHKTISDFIQGAQKYDLRAPALKFGLENIKQKYQMLMTLWRRTERLLEEAVGAGRAKTEEPTSKAISDYADILRSAGHSPTEAMLKEFKNRLDSAYKTAKEKSGASELKVKITQEGGKIKVRMEPK